MRGGQPGPVLGWSAAPSAGALETKRCSRLRGRGNRAGGCAASGEARRPRRDPGPPQSQRGPERGAVRVLLTATALGEPASPGPAPQGVASQHSMSVQVRGAFSGGFSQGCVHGNGATGSKRVPEAGVQVTPPCCAVPAWR